MLKAQPSPDSPATVYMQTMRTFMRLSSEWTNAAAGSLGVHSTDLIAGSYLSEMGPVTAGQLARVTGLTSGAMTAAIGRLERAGFAVRESDPADRRKVYIKPRKLPAKLVVMRKSIAEKIEGIFSQYNNEDLSRMTAITREIIAVFEKEIARFKKEA